MESTFWRYLYKKCLTRPAKPDNNKYNMKKFIYSLPALPIFLMSAIQSFAAPGDTANLDPCEGAIGILAKACAGQDQSIGQLVGFIITIAFVIAILVALLFLVWGGIKWITSGGDKAGVEAARNQIIAAVIGLIVVFLAFFILNLVLTLFGLSLFDLRLPTFGSTTP